MCGDPVELAPGVYLIAGDDPPTDGVLVDRTIAAAAWVAVADVVIDPQPEDDVAQLIRMGTRAYHVLIVAVISAARGRPGESA